MSHPTGGKLIEVAAYSTPGLRLHVARLWVVCTYDGGPVELSPEHCVCVKFQDRMPEPGDHVWWCEDKVYFGDANEQMTMVGCSFPAPSMATEE